LMPVAQWILQRCQETQQRAQKFLENYEVGAARHEIDEFFWKDYCDNYLEIVKDRLYKPEVHGEDNRRSAQFALYHSFLAILKMYGIYVPHITEEIYQGYFRGNENIPSIHSTLWCDRQEISADMLNYGEVIKDILLEVRKYKSERNLSLKTELEALDITVPKQYLLWSRETKKDLLACTGAGVINFQEGETFFLRIHPALG